MKFSIITITHLYALFLSLSLSLWWFAEGTRCQDRIVAKLNLSWELDTAPEHVNEESLPAQLCFVVVSDMIGSVTGRDD